MKGCQFRAYARYMLEYNSWTIAIAAHFCGLSDDIVTALCTNAFDISQRFPGLVAQA